MSKDNQLVLIIKELIKANEPTVKHLERGLYLKYEPSPGEGEPFKLTAARIGKYPHDSVKTQLNWPSRTEQNIVLNALFKALVMSGREIAAMPTTVDDLNNHDGSKWWYGVQWKWQEFKQPALPLNDIVAEQKAGNGYEE